MVLRRCSVRGKRFRFCRKMRDENGSRPRSAVFVPGGRFQWRDAPGKWFSPGVYFQKTVFVAKRGGKWFFSSVSSRGTVLGRKNLAGK